MAHGEIETWIHTIHSAVDRIVACLDGLDAEQLDWRPPHPEANSLLVIATHVLANVEENVCEVIGGEAVGRVREEECAAHEGSAEAVRGRWEGLQGRIGATLVRAGPEALERTYQHPRRQGLTGREVLLVAVRHAAEHAGEAELTRMLLPRP